jgi:hypothetical protein
VKFSCSYKYALTPGDRLWWVKAMTDSGVIAKMEMFFGVSRTTSDSYPNLILYKFYFGPLVLILGVTNDPA